MTELAAAVGVHPAHIARTFRARYGETIGAYVRRRRVEDADRMLVTTNRPLRDIAAEAGFADQAHFTRVYRRYFGVPPGARRRPRSARSTYASRVQYTPGRRR